MHLWRTGDLDIPCQLAPQQSLTPLLQASTFYTLCTLGPHSLWTPELCLENLAEAVQMEINHSNSG